MVRGYRLFVLTLILFYWSNVCCDVIVIPNVPSTIWKELLKLYQPNNTLDDGVHLYKADGSITDESRVKEDKSADYAKNLTATITVWCIASFMILTVFAAIAFFFTHKIRQKHFEPLSTKELTSIGNCNT